MPRVSVIIPTYNCARFLGKTIDSALRQTYRDFEVILVDDGSTDETQALMARYGDSVHYVYQSNQGASAARNVAIGHLVGSLLLILMPTIYGLQKSLLGKSNISTRIQPVVLSTQRYLS